jgi:transposase InsO family protein
MLRRLFTDPAAPSEFSSLHKLQQAAATSKQIKTPAAASSSPHTLRKAAVSHAPSKRTELKQKTPIRIKAWLETQDAYTLHRPLRKRFPRNPYTVNNTDDVWEIDILDLTSLKKFNNYRYLLQVIDVFSRYLHSVPLRTKTGKEVAAALESIFRVPKYTKYIRKRPVCVRTDKGKEFLNTQFQTLLKREGIVFQV